MTFSGPELLDQHAGGDLLKAIQKARPEKGSTVTIDLSTTAEIDSPGGARLVEITDYLHRRGAELELSRAQGHAADFLEVLRPALTPLSHTKHHDLGILENIGEKALRYAGEIREFFALAVDALYWTIIAPLEGHGFRWNFFIGEIHEMGVRAVRIVCLMNFLLGLIIAMLSSAQVSSFGLSIYVADLIMIGFARELAAIMTATVVSARSGAAIAAELATMQVQEEIDALRGMGLNVAQFLIAPRMMALVVVLPCLVALGLLSGLLGGAMWGIFVLGFRPSVWISQTLGAAAFSDLFQGFSKTLVFAVFIALIGCHNGLRVKGGSRGVGLMTTRAVVMDIFMMISIDIVFAAIFYYVMA
jgi:phospholipid/cholesterol/gamma-HCH transport system permease protein